MRARQPTPGSIALTAWSALVFAFLYAPILVLVVFSFNRSRLTAAWTGFTLAWYEKLFADPEVLNALRISLIVGAATTVISVGVGTAAALAFHRHRFRRQGVLDTLITLPIVIPEIALASSLVLLFAALGLRLGFSTVIAAHVAFSVSYVVIVVRARFAGFDRSLEEAAMDLGARPGATFFKVTLPLIAPGVLAAALLVFALSIDDYVITSFVAGVGSTTLPIQIYSMVRTGISPEINAVSTLLLAATGVLLFAAYRVEEGRSARSAAIPAGLGLLVLALPFVLGRPAASGSDRVLNLYIWSNYISPETLRKFEARRGVHVNVDLYDTNEAMLAKVQAGNVAYDVLCPSNYPIPALVKQGALRALDHSALPHLQNLDARFLDQAYDPGNRFSIPYFWSTCGIGYSRRHAGPVRSWAALWDPRFRGRILMVDDPREVFGVALKRLRRSVNTDDGPTLAAASRMLLDQKPLVRTYNSSSYEDALASGDVWLAQGWNGQFAKVMEQDPDLDYVIPEEGATFSVDSLVIPAAAPHPALAHEFLDFTMEAEVAAEICRTMRYSSPNRAAWPLLPAAIRENRAIFPTEEEKARLELINDVGAATVVYERLWTEVKTAP